MNSCLYECHVMHARFTPRRHRFAYRIFLFALDLDELAVLPRQLALFSLNRLNVYSFREQDHLPTTEPLHPPARTPCQPLVDKVANLRARVTGYLAQRGVNVDGGRILLVTLPRIFGYGFNPVSFYFCHDRSGAPVAAIAEVTNTFREIKPYFLGPECRWRGMADGEPAAEEAAAGAPRLQSTPGNPSSVLRHSSSATPSSATFRLRVPKYFYVSPYSDVDTTFDFTLRTPDGRLSIQIDDYVGADRTLTSTVAGSRCELTDARLAWFTLKYPFLTLRIVGGIHWHAFRLWLKRVPWFAKAARAGDQRALFRPHSSIAAASSIDPPPPASAVRSGAMKPYALRPTPGRPNAR